jgi:hypothetical protein
LLHLAPHNSRLRTFAFLLLKPGLHHRCRHHCVYTRRGLAVQHGDGVWQRLRVSAVSAGRAVGCAEPFARVRVHVVCAVALPRRCICTQYCSLVFLKTDSSGQSREAFDELCHGRHPLTPSLAKRDGEPKDGATECALARHRNRRCQPGRERVELMMPTQNLAQPLEQTINLSVAALHCGCIHLHPNRGWNPDVSHPHVARAAAGRNAQGIGAAAAQQAAPSRRTGRAGDQLRPCPDRNVMFILVRAFDGLKTRLSSTSLTLAWTAAPPGPLRLCGSERRPPCSPICPAAGTHLSSL